MSSKWVFLDESGAEPKKAGPAEGDYFALCAVAVDDAEATRPALNRLLLELDPSEHGPGVSRALRRGYFHASEDTPKLRRHFLHNISQLRFHCRIAREPWVPWPAPNAYDALVAEIFGSMGAPGRWTDTMRVVIALRDAQSPATAKGRDYETLFSSVRGYLQRRFPSREREMSATHPVEHVAFSKEPCLQLPDYCGWAVQRWLRDDDEEWLRALSPKGPGWDYNEGRLILPPDTAGLYVAAGEITGVDFFCGP